MMANHTFFSLLERTDGHFLHLTFTSALIASVRPLSVLTQRHSKKGDAKKGPCWIQTKLNK